MYQSSPKIKYEFHDRLYNLIAVLPITVSPLGKAKVTFVYPTESKNILGSKIFTLKKD